MQATDQLKEAGKERLLKKSRKEFEQIERNIQDEKTSPQQKDAEAERLNELFTRIDEALRIPPQSEGLLKLREDMLHFRKTLRLLPNEHKAGHPPADNPYASQVAVQDGRLPGPQCERAAQYRPPDLQREEILLPAENLAQRGMLLPEEKFVQFQQDGDLAMASALSLQEEQSRRDRKSVV